MLSVLIPIYNYDVRKLVMTLVEQCQRAGVNFQVLCFDDGSKSKYREVNRRLENVFGVSYLEFDKNHGRSAMRNKLGFNAMYENLLFLDCDSEVTTKGFIKTYLKNIKEYDCIYGGTKYSKRKPRSTKKILHWKYGQERERLNLKKRNKNPHLSFRSNNFIVKRSIFIDINFDERITDYGHEDTVFANELRKKNINIHHIDNPVVHGGLENADTYLKKTESSIKNLVSLKKRNYDLRTSLTETHKSLDNYGLMPIVRRSYRVFEKSIIKNLHSSNPWLWMLDWVQAYVI